MSSHPIIITGYPDKPPPRIPPPTSFSCLHTVATRILPLLLTIHFCITSAVVLVYALALRRALPVRFVVGVTVTFAVLIASFVLGNCAVWCRRRQRQRERQRERQRRVAHGGAATQNTDDDTTVGSTKSCDPGLVVEEEDGEGVCWRVWMGWLFPCTKKKSREEESASDCQYDGGPAVEAQGQRRELHQLQHQHQHQRQQTRNEVVAPATARSHHGTNGHGDGDTQSGHPFASGGLQDPEPEQQQQQHLNAIYLNSRGSRDSHVSELEANVFHHEYQQQQGNGSSALSFQPNDDSRSAALRPPGPRESARSRSADPHYFTRPVSQHALLVAHPGPGDIGRIALREEGEGRGEGVKTDGRGNGAVVRGLAIREREPVGDLARMEEEREGVRLLRQRQKRKEKQKRKQKQEEDGVKMEPGPGPDTRNPCQNREQRGEGEGEGGIWKPMQKGQDTKLKPLWLPGEVARHSRLLFDSRGEQHGISIPIPIPTPTSGRDPRRECGSESRPGPDARQAQPTQPEPQHLLPIPAPPPPVRVYAPPQTSVSSAAGLSAAVQRPAEGQYMALLGETGCGAGSGYGGYELGWEFGVGMMNGKSGEGEKGQGQGEGRGEKGDEQPRRSRDRRIGDGDVAVMF
ncbi:hypothetical protein LZ554_008718 [Drepanopeziza brunnea f. sp. 'monogermtubi']|nr:hypothetical protein LZ554_008718 [Drepanopeziza brunnea f. sp. 'monogermtubi']